MKKISLIFAGIAFSLSLLFFGCSNSLDEVQPKTGSLTIGTSSSRALAVNNIKTATITITGNKIQGAITERNVPVSAGKGSVTIRNIPVGKNRIVTVQGYGEGGAPMSDAVLRAVVDIKVGNNVIPTINWETSRKGYVYNALFENGVDISALTNEQQTKIDAAIPATSPENINLNKFVTDYKANTLGASSTYQISSGDDTKKLSYIELKEKSELNFAATAFYTDGTSNDITSEADWASTSNKVATVAAGKVTMVGAGETKISASFGGKTSNVASVGVKASSGEGYEADIPAGDWTNIIFLRMSKTATEPSWSNDKLWNRTPKDGAPGVTIEAGKNTYTLKDGWTDCGGTWSTSGSPSKIYLIPNSNWDSAGAWFAAYIYKDGGSNTFIKFAKSTGGGELSATVIIDDVVIPSKPTVKITPSNGKEISLTGKITVSFTENNEPITSKTVTVNGANKPVTGNTLTIDVSTLGVSAGNKITVNASAASSLGTVTDSAQLTVVEKEPVPDTFTWDNILCYFVLTDRFYNGDTSNDSSYYRTPSSKAGSTPTVALFHGGDIKGLTQKIDYFDNLGVNAIWITAPYEQAHGWVGGKDGKFPHYAFHGYYTLDWTFMDANMGTIEEFREFVNACHEKGIRVVVDVVMNHVGYNNTEDMITYNHGYTEHKDHGWLAMTNGKWDANDTVKWDNSYWESWFGPWISSFAYDRGAGVGGSCGGLPDIRTELTSSVGMAPVLVTKWKAELNDASKKPYILPSVSNVDWNGKSGDWRTDKGVAPSDYQVMWLSAWVREFGIDGFRCDTAKHVEPFRWGQLKDACESALKAWRADKSKSGGSGDDAAKDWDENFWMTGEYFGWTARNGQGDYYTTGKFDSMINFSFNGSSGNTGRCPTASDWGSYISINNNGDSDNNGNRNNVLSYVSSHDTGLHRSSGAIKLGTYLGLLPGGVQVYYGDESDRPEIDGLGDADMKTRGDMDFLPDSDAKIKHWHRIGSFRKFNPAVGAGTGSANKRSYDGPAGKNNVAISVSGTQVDVSGLFTDGTTVYNWYDGESATVSDGKVTFKGGTDTQPILVSDRNPADFGVDYTNH